MATALETTGCIRIIRDKLRRTSVARQILIDLGLGCWRDQYAVGAVCVVWDWLWAGSDFNDH